MNSVTFKIQQQGFYILGEVNVDLNGSTLEVDPIALHFITLADIIYNPYSDIKATLKI